MSDDLEEPAAWDRVAILARRRRFIQLAMTGVVAAAPVGCPQPCLSLAPDPLLADGLYVCYLRDDIDCDGCDAVTRGSIIVRIDDTKVDHPEQLDRSLLLDGQPHAVTFWAHSPSREQTVEVRVRAGEAPWRTVTAEALDRAPPWARRRLFGHAAPRLQLVDLDGAMVSGADLYGRRRLLVLFEWTTPFDLMMASTALEVLQKANGDLEAAGVEPLLAQLDHPRAPSDAARPPMNETELRAFFEQHQLSASEGGPLPPPRLLRTPNKTEQSPEHSLGLEGEMSVLEALGAPPTIVILDERGIIRWHSDGVIEDPTGTLPSEQYAIIQAVLFALEKL